MFLLTTTVRQAPTISLILLTHPTVAHIGAYAHCCKHIPLFSRIPVYATTPVISFGRTLIQDLYTSNPLASATIPANALAELNPASTPQDAKQKTHILLPRPSDEEIAAYFSLIHPLKYSQEHQPVSTSNGPPLEGLTITAYPAGHTVGGTIWHIRHASESIVYAVDWNQARENVIAGAAWLGSGATSGSEVIDQLRQPTALVCSSKQSQSAGFTGGWRARDDQLLGYIRTIAVDKGTILIPCDTSARVLELAFMLERAWMDDDELRKIKLALVTHTTDATMKYARSMLEWMDEKVVREFESNATSRASSHQAGKTGQPFEFKHLKLMERQTQVDRALTSSGPKVFLASCESLDCGFSKYIFEKLYSDSKNLLVLPCKVSHLARQQDLPRSISAQVFANLKDDNIIVQLDELLHYQDPRIAGLGLDEIAVYQQYMARQRQRLNASAVDGSTAFETSADIADDHSSSSSSSEDSDDEHQGKALNTATTMQHSKHKLGLTDEELGINVLLRRKDAHDFDIRGKRGRERVYPFIGKRKRNDEFGDVIRPEDYLRAEERDDVDAQKGLEGVRNEDTKIGQKRRLDGKGASGIATNHLGLGKNINKRRKNGQGEDGPSQSNELKGGPTTESSDAAESEESDYEPAEPVVLGPQKVDFAPKSVHVKVKAVSIDFSGIHDKRSLQMLLPLIKPRKLILTGGAAEDTRRMKDDCTRILSGQKGKMDDTSHATITYAPETGERIDASVDTNAWSLRLSRTLLKGLTWQKYRHLGVVTVDGQIEEPPQEENNPDVAAKRLKLAANNAPLRDESQSDSSPVLDAMVPVLNTLPTGAAAMTRSFTQSNHVGDLRLAELRKILQDRGHVAQFKGEGTLLVDDHIAVRKNGVGKIEVESGGGFAAIGSFGTGLDTVKQKIYEGLATVAAR